MNRLRLLLLHVLALMSFGCGSSDDGSSKLTFPNAGDPQTPPTTGDAAAMQAWIEAGHYEAWQCEANAHAPSATSMHGQNRACSNDLVSAFTGKSSDERPAGSAAVKEFWDGGKVIGHAAYVKTADASNAGDAWYWYVQIDGMGVLANGSGSSDMVAKMVCVACHAAAGKDEAHTTSSRSGDFVYTQVEQ